MCDAAFFFFASIFTHRARCAAAILGYSWQLPVISTVQVKLPIPNEWHSLFVT
jgi:hypothetical protein